MSKENYQNKIRELPESIKQFGGLVIVTIIVISFFFILNEMDFSKFLFSDFSIVLTHSLFISSNIFLFGFKNYSIEVAILYPSAIY